MVSQTYGFGGYPDGLLIRTDHIGLWNIGESFGLGIKTDLGFGGCRSGLGSYL